MSFTINAKVKLSGEIIVLNNIAKMFKNGISPSNSQSECLVGLTFLPTPENLPTTLASNWRKYNWGCASDCIAYKDSVKIIAGVLHLEIEGNYCFPDEVLRYISRQFNVRVNYTCRAEGEHLKPKQFDSSNNAPTGIPSSANYEIDEAVLYEYGYANAPTKYAAEKLKITSIKNSSHGQILTMSRENRDPHTLGKTYVVDGTEQEKISSVWDETLAIESFIPNDAEIVSYIGYSPVRKVFITHLPDGCISMETKRYGIDDWYGSDSDKAPNPYKVRRDFYAFIENSFGNKIFNPRIGHIFFHQETARRFELINIESLVLNPGESKYHNPVNARYTLKPIS